MTGLSLADDALIEIAVIVTDSQLHALDEGIDIIITPPEAAVEQMGDFVREMHTTSGLLEDLPHGTTLADARSEEHTSELQSRGHLVCRLLLEKKRCEASVRVCPRLVSMNRKCNLSKETAFDIGHVN